MSLLYTRTNNPIRLVDLLMREPLASLEILLLERRIEYTQSPYFSSAGRIVAFYVGFGFAVGGLEGEGTCGLWRGMGVSFMYPPFMMG